MPKHTIDLTTGNLHRQLLTLFLPLMIGNIFQQFYNTIDCYIAGNYIHQDAFAALGIAGTIMNLFIFIINGCCNGISIVFAQVYGSKDVNKLKQEAFLSLCFGFLFSIVLTILGLLFLRPLLSFISTPERLVSYVVNYVSIILLFLFVTFLYNWFACVLRAVGDTHAALYSLIVSIFLNILLDIFFVLCLHTGVIGLAIATIISQACSSLFCYHYLRHRYPFLLFTRKDMVVDVLLLSNTMRYGCISALHQSSLYIGKFLIQGTVNMAGIDCVIAYSLTMRIEGVINSFGDSGCTAISIIVGQNLGADNKKRIHQTFHCGLKWMSILCITLSVGMVLLTTPFVHLFMQDASIVIHKQTYSYMLVISFFYIFCFIGNCFVGLYRGLGLVHIPVLGTLLHISIRVILSYIWIDTFQLSAIAFASGIGWICVVIFQCIVYRNVKTTI